MTDGPMFPKPSRQDRKAAKKAARAARSDKVAAIREACLERGRHRCEAPDCRRLVPLQLDHWLGGGGRRRAEESVETCWMLCVDCHLQRTRNVPSVRWWNDAFAKHCASHHYAPPVLHLERFSH